MGQGATPGRRPGGRLIVYYLVAILLPPLAVLICGKPFQALLNVPLTIALWVPGMIHALLVVHNFYADQRTQRMIDAMRQERHS
jgi:uncharacterized membrane protein YqaE (UPF0057 family)